MLDIGHEPTKVVQAVARAFPLVHVTALAIRQNCHSGLSVRRPADHPVLRSYSFARRRLAEAKDVDVKIEHLVVVRDAHRKMTDTRKRTLDLRRVELVRGKANGLATGIRHTIIPVKEAACFLANIRIGGKVLEPIFDLAYVFDGDA